MKKAEHEIYHKLVKLIKEKGVYREKKHGNYVDLFPLPNYQLTLDTWNNSISVIEKSGKQESIGIDWGRFECKMPKVEFWLAQLSVNSSQLTNPH